MVEISKIQKDLETRLSAYRFKHVLSVTETAITIASAYHLDQETIHKITIAALLHDICKELPKDDILVLAKFYSIKIFDVDLLSPNLLHSRVGAAYAEDHYDIVDPRILKAIEEHTFGPSKDLICSKIVFLADLIEPNRDNGLDQNLNKIRQIIFEQKDLDQAVLAGINLKIQEAIDKNKSIHPLSIEARNIFVIS